MPVFVDDMTLASKLKATLDEFVDRNWEDTFKLQDLGLTTQLLVQN